MKLNQATNMPIHSRPHPPVPRVSKGIFKCTLYSLSFFTALSGSLISQAATAVIEGEAPYLERIMPPPDATLMVTLENATRADAPAVAHASSSMLLGNGPPYAWRLTYDTTLGDPQQLNLRAQITTPAGLWMSTDTRVSAASSAAPLRLRLMGGLRC